MDARTTTAVNTKQNLNNQIEVFNNPEFGSVRTVVINDQPFFVGKDIATILGYANPAKAVINRVADEDKGVTKMGTPGGIQNVTIINESGLYSLILSSKLPSAQKFKHWITAEVLPSIRRHGAYMTPDTLKQVIADPDFLIGLLMQLKNEKAEKLSLQTKVKQLTPKARYCDMVLKSPSLATTSIIAKDYGMAAISFNQLLHDLGIQFKQDDVWLLYAKYQNKGYTAIDTIPIQSKNGSIRVKYLTKWTQKGRLFLYEKLKSVGILPMMEINMDSVDIGADDDFDQLDADTETE